MLSLPNNRQARPLVLGEVLLDCFPDGRDVIGGAPFNVAWNLQGFNGDPIFVSAIGPDDRGHNIQRTMDSWGIDSAHVSTVDDQPTGQVKVSLSDGQPSYEIVQPVAWDFIPNVSDSIDLENLSIVYHGSLIFRSEVSRRTVENLIDRVAASPRVARYVDINIREPWFDASWLPRLLGGANYVKLNEIELSQITGLPCTSGDEIQSAVNKFASDFNLAANSAAFVTCGSEGAYVVSSDQLHFSAAPKIRDLVDTVGAGDAFASRTIDGLIRDEAPQTILDQAVRFAGRVCALRGATTSDKTVYAASPTRPH